MHFDVVRVHADSGNIGGNRSHEFHVVTPQGFDDLLRCSCCDYAANVEKATSRIPLSSSSSAAAVAAGPKSSPDSKPELRWSPNGDARVAALMRGALEKALVAGQKRGLENHFFFFFIKMKLL